jgi:hypothetical protein
VRAGIAALAVALLMGCRSRPSLPSESPPVEPSTFPAVALGGSHEQRLEAMLDVLLDDAVQRQGMNPTFAARMRETLLAASRRIEAGTRGDPAGP